MRVGMGEFRLNRLRGTILKGIVTLAYFVGVVACVVFGLRSYRTGAISGGQLVIPSINLDTTTEISELTGRQFSVPAFSVGAYYANENKVFLMGHRATIFKNLEDTVLGDEIVFADNTYTVKSISVKAKEEIDMVEILAPASEPTLVLMTCHGVPVSDTDYSHRLIVTATK